MNESERIRLEAEAILCDPELQRAPSQTRILRYLAEKAGDSTECISQYELATEALGRRDDFDETTDSVVRVQMGRLRKSLADHYRRLSPDDDMYIYIRQGEYRLRLGPAHVAYPDLARSPVAVPTSPAPESPAEPAPARAPAPAPEPAPPPTEREELKDQSLVAPTRTYVPLLAKLALVAALIAITIQIFLYVSQTPNITENFDGSAYVSPAAPLVKSELRISDQVTELAGMAGMQNDIENAIDRVLQMSLISRSQLRGSEETPDYVVYTLLTSGALPDTVNIFATMRDRAGHMIGTKSLSDVPLAESKMLIPQVIISLTSPSGRLSSHLAKQIKAPASNGFECYILIENFRSRGEGYKALLDDCEARFGDSSYGSTFQARQLIQKNSEFMLQGGRLSKDTQVWAGLDDLLRRHPEDPYANSLAAKMLIGLGKCEEAMGFVQNGYSRGTAFPSLEVSPIVDAYGCPEATIPRAALNQRVKTILAAERDSDSPVLRAFLLIACILAEQKPSQTSLVGLQSSWKGEQKLEQFNHAVGKQLQGTASKEDVVLIKAVLSQLVWNDYARWEVQRKLKIA